MLRRLRGLFIITRALLPLLLVAGAALITWFAGQALVDATRDYGQDLSTQLDGIRGAIDEANEGLVAIGAYVTEQATAAEELLSRVAELRDRLEIDLPFSDELLTIPIPGVEPLQRLAGDLAEAGRRAAEPVLKLAALAEVPPQLEQLGTDTADYARDVRSAVWGWVAALLALFVVGGLIWLISTLRPLTDELGRGWAMLIGRKAPARSARDLEQRVRQLERRLGER